MEKASPTRGRLGPSKYPTSCCSCGATIGQGAPSWWRGREAPKGRRMFCPSLACIPQADHGHATAQDGNHGVTLQRGPGGALPPSPVGAEPQTPASPPAPAVLPDPATVALADTAPAPAPAAPQRSDPQSNGLAELIARAVAPHVSAAVDADGARGIVRQELAGILRRLRRHDAPGKLPEPVDSIPTADPTYQAATETGELVRACLATDTHAWVTGPSGAGKTFPIVQECAAAGRHCLVLSCTEGMDRSALLGQWILERAPNNGHAVMRWAFGPLPRAMASGAVLVVDEADKMSPALSAIFFSVCEQGKPRSLYVPECGQTIEPAPGFVVLFTGNVLRDAGAGGYSGQRPDSALLTRCLHVPADYLPLATETGILAHYHKGAAEPVAQTLAELRTAHDAGAVSTPPSLRAGIAVACAMAGRAPNGRPLPKPLSWRAAWTLALVGSLPPDEASEAQTIIDKRGS